MKRRWLFAVVVSVLFHGVLVVGFRALLERARQADLASMPPAPPAAPAQTTKTVEFIRIGLQERTAAAPRPTSAAPGVGPRVVAPATLTELAPAAEPAAAAEASSPGETQTVVEATAPEPLEGVPGAEPSAELIAAVQARLAQGAARCYPPAALRFRQTGVVSVGFCASGSGELEQILVNNSSGSALLDQAAVDCVVPSANPLPLAAAGACFRLPVRFGEK